MMNIRWEFTLSGDTNSLVRKEIGEMLKHCDLTIEQCDELSALLSGLNEADQIVINLA